MKEKKLWHLLKTVRCPYCEKPLDNEEADMMSDGIIDFYDELTVNCLFGCGKNFVLKMACTGVKPEEI